MFYVFSPYKTSVSNSFIDSVIPSLDLPGSPGCESLSFASPKESNQRKGDPQSGSLRFASGNFRCSKSAEFLETSLLRSRRTSKNLFPLPPALLSPARTGGESGSPHPCPLPEEEGVKPRFELGACLYPLSLRERVRVRVTPNSLPQPVLAGLEKVEGDGLKNLDVRRRRSRLVSRFSGSFSFFKEPRSGPDCGSPFFSLGFFGEAKKSKSPAGASPGMLARSTSLTPVQRRQQEANN